MLLLFSAIYIVLNVVLIKSAGAVGLIAANSISILWLITTILFPLKYLLRTFFVP